MGRFFNREAAVVAATLLVSGVAIGWQAGLGPAVIAAVSCGLLLVLHWPLTALFQDWVLELYVEHGRLDRALALAVEIRDAAPTGRARGKALLDLAFVQLARGDAEAALRNLNAISLATFRTASSRTVVEATTAYCLAQLGREFERAESLLEGARKRSPDEPLFDYFAGLLRFKQGRLAEAKELIAGSLRREPDPALPHPGERPYVLAHVLSGLGETEAARAQLQAARAAKGRFGELADGELK